MSKSTPSRRRKKASAAGKPHPEMPLTKHPRGYWCKKVKGKLHYFGRIQGDEQGEAALAEWLRVKDWLLAGKEPPATGDGLTLAELFNRFLTFKKQLVDSGELAPRSLEEYRGTTDLLVATFGARRLVDSLTAADFQELRGVFSKRYGVFRVGNSIQRVRTIFRFGYDAGLIDKPLRFGPGFKKPSAKAVREQRQAHGPRLFVPEELRAVLKHSTVNIKAMVLLGINGGLGNTDVAMLPLSAVDLTGGWLVYPRAKTAIGRKIPLWPETREAIRQALSERGEPKDPSEQDLVFIGRRGESYVCEHHGYRVHQEFARVLKKAGVANRTFYDLRRTFQTVSEGAHDLSATQAVMGHAAGSGDMSAIYRQSVDDDRLQAVVAHVRNWLFGTAGAHVDDVHHQASGKSAPPDAQLARAIDRARGAIAAATGPTRRTLESAWLAEIDNATRGDSEARRRLLEVWGQDDRDDRPRLRVVS